MLGVEKSISVLLTFCMFTGTLLRISSRKRVPKPDKTMNTISTVDL